MIMVDNLFAFIMSIIYVTTNTTFSVSLLPEVVKEQPLKMLSKAGEAQSFGFTIGQLYASPY